MATHNCKKGPSQRIDPTQLSINTKAEICRLDTHPEACSHTLDSRRLRRTSADTNNLNAVAEALHNPTAALWRCYRNTGNVPLPLCCTETWNNCSMAARTACSLLRRICKERTNSAAAFLHLLPGEAIFLLSRLINNTLGQERMEGERWGAPGKDFQTPGERASRAKTHSKHRAQQADYPPLSVGLRHVC